MPPPLALGIGLGLSFGGSLWTPANEPDLLFWYDGDTVSLTSGNVSSWTDLSGHGRHLTDGGVSTRRPTPIAGGLNGHQTVRFNGTSNWLQAVFTSNQPRDVFIVLKMLAFGALSTNDAVFDGGTDLSNFFGASTTVGDSSFIYAGTAVASSTRIADGAFEQAEMVYNGVSSALYHGASGIQLTSGNAGANNAGGFTLGASGGGTRFTNIEVAGVFGFGSAKSAAVRSQARQYITARWRA